MQYTPYAFEMIELMKKLTSGKITSAEYKYMRTELERKYRQKPDRISINCDKKPYSDSNTPEYRDDCEMIYFLEKLAQERNPNMIEPDALLEKKPKRRRLACQTNTLS